MKKITTVEQDRANNRGAVKGGTSRPKGRKMPKYGDYTKRG